jgi:hypothetical protein
MRSSFIRPSDTGSVIDILPLHFWSSVPDNDFYFRYVALDRPPRSPLPFAYTLGVVVHWNLGSSFSGSDRRLRVVAGRIDRSTDHLTGQFNAAGIKNQKPPRPAVVAKQLRTNRLPTILRLAWLNTTRL